MQRTTSIRLKTLLFRTSLGARSVARFERITLFSSPPTRGCVEFGEYRAGRWSCLPPPRPRATSRPGRHLREALRTTLLPKCLTDAMVVTPLWGLGQVELRRPRTIMLMPTTVHHFHTQMFSPTTRFPLPAKTSRRGPAEPLRGAVYSPNGQWRIRDFAPGTRPSGPGPVPLRPSH